MKKRNAPRLKQKDKQKAEELSCRYTFQIEWNAEQNCHQAKCAMLPSLLAVGKTPEAALKKIISAVAKELRSHQERGEYAPQPIYKQVIGY